MKKCGILEIMDIILFILGFIITWMVLNALFTKKTIKHCDGKHRWVYKVQENGWETLVCGDCNKIPGEDHGMF